MNTIQGKLKAPFAALLLVSTSPWSYASTIQYTLSGYISGIDAPLQGGPVSVGDRVLGQFQVETDPLHLNDTAQIASYTITNVEITIGDNYQFSAPGGFIQVDRGGNRANYSFHVMQLVDNMVGPAINQVWVPDYFHQHIWKSIDHYELPSDFLANASDTQSRSQLRFNGDDSVQISVTLNHLALSEPEVPIIAPNDYYAVTAISDINGNGLSEIAFLRTVSSGNIHVLYRDVLNRDYIKTVTFFNTSYQPLSITTIPDVNGNGYDEVAVMAINPETGVTRTVIKDSLTDERISYFDFSP